MRNTVGQLLVVLGLFVLATRAFAGVLLWPVDARTGVTQMAEQSEWAQFLYTGAPDINFLSPTDEGLVSYYSMMLTDTPDIVRLQEGAGLAGAEASVWIRLDAFGALWVFANPQGSSTLNTDAGVSGMTEGTHWVKQQMGIPVPDNSRALNSEMAPVVANPNFVYREPGTRILVSGVMDAADYLRLTKGISSLQGVSFVFPAKTTGTEVELVVGAEYDAYTLGNLLAQQPWLEEQSSGRYRWNALGAAVSPINQNQ